MHSCGVFQILGGIGSAADLVLCPLGPVHQGHYICRVNHGENCAFSQWAHIRLGRSENSSPGTSSIWWESADAELHHKYFFSWVFDCIFSFLFSILVLHFSILLLYTKLVPMLHLVLLSHSLPCCIRSHAYYYVHHVIQMMEGLFYSRQAAAALSSRGPRVACVSPISPGPRAWPRGTLCSWSAVRRPTPQPSTTGTTTWRPCRSRRAVCSGYEAFW